MEAILQEIQIETSHMRGDNPPRTIEDKIRVLAVARYELAEQKELNARQIARFMDSISEELTAEKELKEEVSRLEKEIKTEAAAAYMADKSIGKKPWAGVGIQCGEKTEYTYDPANAYDWALEKKMCLALDTDAFEAICATPSKPAFVEEKKYDTFKAVLDKDLSKALGA